MFHTGAGGCHRETAIASKTTPFISFSYSSSSSTTTATTTSTNPATTTTTTTTTRPFLPLLGLVLRLLLWLQQCTI